MNFLADMVRAKRIEVRQARRSRPLSAVVRAARRASAPRDFYGALDRALPVGIIAEVKPASPSAGALRPGVDAAAQARAYEAGGAAAVSVLTDGPHFGGSLANLRRARAACRLPVLRKDFVVDEYQVAEARAAGADAVLLIAGAVSNARLCALVRAARRYKCEPLVEATTGPELRSAVRSGARLIGINNRDLRTLEMDPTRVRRLAPRVPAGRLIVAESGIRSGRDVAVAVRDGARAVLVGEHLMRSRNPARALRALIAGAGCLAGHGAR